MLFTQNYQNQCMLDETTACQSWLIFYCTTRMHSTDYATCGNMSVRPSVRHMPVLCVNDYTCSQSFFHHRVAPPFQFFRTKWDGNITTVTPLTGAPNASGYEKKSRFSTSISLYLANDARQSHSYYGTQIGNRTQAFEWYKFE